MFSLTATLKSFKKVLMGQEWVPAI